MSRLKEQWVFHISEAELERRWEAARRIMREQRIDALVMQASNEFKGGYLRWFTDSVAKFDGPVSVVFPLEGRMTLIVSGPRGGRREIAPDMVTPYRGVGLVLTEPYSQADCITDHADGELAVGVLRELAPKRIGMLGLGSMRYSFGEAIYRAFPDCEIINASDAIDRIKAIKSPEEIALIRQCAQMQDEIWELVLDYVRPGMREYEVATYAYAQCQLKGSTDGLILTGSAPLGVASVKGHRHFQNRVLQKGDQFTMLIEVNGPGGYYTELGRTCVLGRASQELLDEFEIVREAQDATVALLRPGATPTEIWNRHNAFMRGRDRPEENRLFCHGQGYDLVERPALRDDDAMPVAVGMNLVVHPTYATSRVYSWLCDNFLVQDHATPRLHGTERKIFELA